MHLGDWYFFGRSATCLFDSDFDQKLLSQPMRSLPFAVCIVSGSDALRPTHFIRLCRLVHLLGHVQSRSSVLTTSLLFVLSPPPPPLVKVCSEALIAELLFFIIQCL